jgi:hypothetical protein
VAGAVALCLVVASGVTRLLRLDTSAVTIEEARKRRARSVLIIAAVLSTIVLVQMSVVVWRRTHPVRDVVRDGVRYTLVKGNTRTDWVPLFGMFAIACDAVIGIKNPAVLTKAVLASGEVVEERIEWLDNVYEKYPFLR